MLNNYFWKLYFYIFIQSKKTFYKEFPYKSKINLLGYSENLEWKNVGNGILISIPKKIQNDPACKYAWTFKLNDVEKFYN